MNLDSQSHFEVMAEPDLWRAIQWATNETSAKVRVIQTCVGAYGAVDQGGATRWFDVGDVLINVLDNVIVVSSAKAKTFTASHLSAVPS